MKLVPRLKITLALSIVGLATASLGARALVPAVGDAAARRIARLTSALPAPTDSADLATEADPVPSSAEEPPADPPSAPGAGRVRRSARRPSAKPAAGGALEIPADRLANLTEKQLRSLHATDAVDTAGRALGAKLHGVSALGVGLADGDVVTSIDGRATPDVNAATAAAMSAYASGEPAAHATVLRAGRTVLVTVHIPARRPADRKGTCGGRCPS